MYYDAHTHLNDEKLYPQWKNYLEKFVTIGWQGMVTVGVDTLRSQKALDIVIESRQLYPSLSFGATIGHHPSEVCFGKICSLDDITTSIQQLDALYTSASDCVVAIGECGIDTHYPWDSLIDIQKALFAAQCDFAVGLHLPVVVHSRDDFSSTWDVVQQYPDLTFYFHCWWYSAQELLLICSQRDNVYFGFDGNITYPKANTLRWSLLACPLDRILLETDAPYLAPQVIRWQVNEPANIPMIYDYVTKLLDLPLVVLQNTLQSNFMRLFGRL